MIVKVACLLAGALLVLAADRTRYRVCIPDDHKSRKTLKYCPLLDEENSPAQCVLGNSRLDCLRLISEDRAEMGVFEAEDLVVAANYRSDDFAVTHSIQHFAKEKYEFEVVAVVSKAANISNLSQLRGKRLCHPGFGYESDWSEVISKYFEARVVPQRCEPALALEENAVKSSSEFFQAACKAGPWVLDPRFDAELKSKYRNLCALCDLPGSCSTLDKYWGRRGPLYCLTDGMGDVAWARLDDIHQHFGFLPSMPPVASADNYDFMCGDGSLASLSKSQQCAWVTRPWSAIVAKRKLAAGVQKLVSSLGDSSRKGNWKLALQQILESDRLYVVPLDTIMVPEDFLARAPGFLSANNMAHCGAQRLMRVCTRSNVENAKCNWLKEAAQAMGVEPRLFCVRAHSTQDCLLAVHTGIADVVPVEGDLQVAAQRKYNLKPLLYEYSSHAANMRNIAAVVRSDSAIKTLGDLRGKKACFPSYEGAGWNTMLGVLRNLTLLPAVCPYEDAVAQFFSGACAPGMNTSLAQYQHLSSLCDGDHSGESGAFKCLASGKADVAFIALNTISNYTDGASNESWAASLKHEDFRSLCIENSTEQCYLAWATPGQMMVKSTLPAIRGHEFYSALKEIAGLFGSVHKTQIPMFQLFGEFSGQRNVLFHDTTESFQDFESLLYMSRKPRNYEVLLAQTRKCSTGSAAVPRSAAWVVASAVLLLLQ